VGALFLGPAFERRSAGEIESVEKGLCAERNRACTIAGGEGGAKLGHVRRHESFVKNERGPRGTHDLTPEVLPQGVACLAERVCCTTVVSIGPKEARKAVTRHTAISRRREHREQSKSRRSESRRGSPVVGRYAEATKGQQAKHVTADVAATRSDCQAKFSQVQCKRDVTDGHSGQSNHLQIERVQAGHIVLMLIRLRVDV